MCYWFVSLSRLRKWSRRASVYLYIVDLFKARNKSNWGPNLLKLEQFSFFQSVWNDIEYYRKDPHSLRNVMSRVRNMLGSIPIISTNYYTIYISCFSSNRETWRSQNNGRAISTRGLLWSITATNHVCYRFELVKSNNQRSYVLVTGLIYFCRSLRAFVLVYLCKIFSFFVYVIRCILIVYVTYTLF